MKFDWKIQGDEIRSTEIFMAMKLRRLKDSRRWNSVDWKIHGDEIRSTEIFKAMKSGRLKYSWRWNYVDWKIHGDEIRSTERFKAMKSGRLKYSWRWNPVDWKIHGDEITSTQRFMAMKFRRLEEPCRRIQNQKLCNFNGLPMFSRSLYFSAPKIPIYLGYRVKRKGDFLSTFVQPIYYQNLD
jgi:hypothetical protein